MPGPRSCENTYLIQWFVLNPQEISASEAG